MPAAADLHTQLAGAGWTQLEGIGFTDLVKRHSGMDKDLPQGAFDAGRVLRSVERHQPTALAFNGKKAAKAFFTRLAVQPSGNCSFRRGGRLFISSL